MYQKRVQVGNLFMNLTALIFGGEIQKNGVNNPNTGSPDIIHWERNQVYESKSSISSDHNKIDPAQVKHYRTLVDSDFPLTDGEAYYFFWQHSKRGISQFDGNELERNIISHINRLLVVSLDVVEAGLNIWDTTGHTCSWGETYMFRSSERRNLTFDTNTELIRMGLKPQEYTLFVEDIKAGEYKYKWWSLPEFRINRVIRKGMRDVVRV